MPSHVKPTPAIEPGRLDHQRIPLPPANRVPQPRRIRLTRQLTTVQKDLTELRHRFIENHDQVSLLNDLKRIANCWRAVEYRNALWQAVSGRKLVRVSPGHSFLSES